jgi:hypothetical protein
MVILGAATALGAGARGEATAWAAPAKPELTEPPAASCAVAETKAGDVRRWTGRVERWMRGNGALAEGGGRANVRRE